MFYESVHQILHGAGKISSEDLTVDTLVTQSNASGELKIIWEIFPSQLLTTEVDPNSNTLHQILIAVSSLTDIMPHVNSFLGNSVSFHLSNNYFYCFSIRASIILQRLDWSLQYQSHIRFNFVSSKFTNDVILKFRLWSAWDQWAMKTRITYREFVSRKRRSSLTGYLKWTDSKSNNFIKIDRYAQFVFRVERTVNFHFFNDLNESIF